MIAHIKRFIYCSSTENFWQNIPTIKFINMGTKNIGIEK